MARISYLLLTTLSILTTLLLPPPTSATVPLLPNTTLTTLSSQNNTYTPPTHKCSKPRFYRTDKRPTWGECYRAIRTLPSSYDQRTFHNRGINDGYRLPMVEKFGRCRAQVEIADRVTAVSSWVEVAAALDQLAILCRRMTVPEGWRVAGWLVMGPEERIKVSLLGPGDEVDDGGVGGGLNGTGRGVE